MATQTGYKASELGMIPQDWDVVELEEVAEIKSGGTPSTNRPEFWNGHILWCTPTDITSLSGKYLSDTNRKISELGLNNSAAELLPTGSVLMTSRATIGECAIVKRPMTTNQGFKNFICNRTVNNEFLYYLLSSQKDKFIELCNGSTFLEISTTQVLKFKITIPKSITEQTAIATVLSDTDALISSLQTLIAKKKAIKLSAMQNLLSGKIRLPEFAQRTDGSPKTTRQTELGCVPEDWEVVELGKRFETFSGGTPSTSIKGYYGGDIKWITSSDLNKGIIYDVENTITELGFQNSSAKKVKKDTLLLALYGATAGVVGITKIDATINQAVLAIIPKRDSSLFLYYWLSFNKNKIIETYAQGGQANLSGDIVRAFNIVIPKSITEQSAIAQLLSDMDAEIEALECRLKKTQALKQGMMQTLLTGKIRLPLE